MLNLVVNILWGFICQTIYFTYIFDKTKGKHYISSYFIFIICYLISMFCSNFTYNRMYLTYIIVAVLFSIIYTIVHKIKYKVTDMLLMLNILLISSVLTAIPIIFIGYNKIYLIINIVEILGLFILALKLPLNKYYSKIIPNWNRTNNNKIKSITLRNCVIITSYFAITFINIFLNEIFLRIYQKLL